MKKTVIQIIFCLLFIATQLLIELYPMARSYTERQLREMDIDSMLSSRSMKKYTTLLNNEEIKGLKKIKEFQFEFCKKQN